MVKQIYKNFMEYNFIIKTVREILKSIYYLGHLNKKKKR